ncbi:MAG: hypothetical protein C0525_05165 [Flavobacterium sp.]|nr:hypothetical protein [Flavobacterium sp.]
MGNIKRNPVRDKIRVERRCLIGKGCNIGKIAVINERCNPVRDSMLPYVFLNRLLCKGFEKEID